MAKRSNCLIINMDLNELVLGVVGENLRAYTVWLVIYRHAHATDGFAWPSFDTIAKSAKLPNKRNLRRYLAVLEKLGLLDVIRNGKKWGYSIPVQYRQAVYGKRKKTGNNETISGNNETISGNNETKSGNNETRHPKAIAVAARV